MSLNRVNSDVNKFGYRLLTPNGDIMAINHSDIRNYRADDNDALVLSTLTTQTKALDSLDIPVIMAAKGGALIIASTAETAEKASAYAFPVREYDRTPRQAVRAAEKAEGLKATLMNNFDFAASGQFVPVQLPSVFASAARKIDNVVRPVFSSDFDDIRLAA